MRYRLALLLALVLLLALPAALQASGAGWTGRLRPVEGAQIRGNVSWPGMTEAKSLSVDIKGAPRLANLSARVCGLSAVVDDSGTRYYDGCWAAFVDSDRHVTDFATNPRGKAHVVLSVKIGAGPAHLVKPERVQVYEGAEVVAVAKLKEGR